MNKEVTTIWSDDHCSDWFKAVKDSYNEMRADEDEPEWTDEEIYEEIYENLLEDLRHYDPEESGCFIVEGSLALWDGVRHGFKDFAWNKGLYPVMQSLMYDFNTIYVEDGDLKLSSIHHDGTNGYTFRYYTGDDVDELIERLCELDSEKSHELYLKETSSLVPEEER